MQPGVGCTDTWHNAGGIRVACHTVHAVHNMTHSCVSTKRRAMQVSYSCCAQVWEAARKLLAKPRQLAQQDADLQVGVRSVCTGHERTGR